MNLQNLSKSVARARSKNARWANRVLSCSMPILLYSNELLVTAKTVGVTAAGSVSR
jgi:hypothetical protein